MRRFDIMRRAARNLRQAKGRTFLTSLAIAVGAFTLTLSLAAGEGARQYADNLLKNNVDPQSLFVAADGAMTSGGSTQLVEYTDSTTAGYRPGSTMKLLTKADIAKLEARKDVRDVIPLYTVTPTYTVFDGVSNKKYTASITYYDSTVKADVVAGQLPALGQQIADDQILVPEDYAKELGVAPNAMVGQKVSVTFTRAAQTPTDQEIQEAFMSGGQEAVTALVKSETKTYIYTVRAVLKKSAMAIMSTPRLHISVNAAKLATEFTEGDAKSAGQVAAATVMAVGDPETVKQSLEHDYGFNVQTAKDAQSMIFSFVNILQGIVAGFALLALIASVFGIINTQYISVLERTSQIGLMKALGMSRGGVAKLFRYEAAWIGFLGGILGAGLAIAAGVLLNPTITKALSLGENTLLIFEWWQIAIMIAGLVIVAIVAGWLPARKAARLDPIEALRTE